MTFIPCAIIPSFNHHQAISVVVEALRNKGLPIIIVDDGSQSPAKEVLAALHDPDNGISVIRLATNKGKGAAVMTGISIAIEREFSHALQIDADGQHDLTKLTELLQLAESHPEALISGRPIYDESMPLTRRLGRWITHVWVWLETLSFRIIDSMCGFRVYPLATVATLLEDRRLGCGMDFDTEIMVRLFWRGTPPISLPINVTYPHENTSNFRPLKDNWLITKMHTRLVFTLLFNFVEILRHRPPTVLPTAHWARMDERGASWGLTTLALVYRAFGRRLCRILMEPVLLYFFLTSKTQRLAIRKYRERLGAHSGLSLANGFWDGYPHFRAFGEMALDKFGAWIGAFNETDFTFDDNGLLDATVATGRGVLVIVSHIGNIEVSRSLSKQRTDLKITVFAHTQNAVKFNDLITRINPTAAIDIVEVNEINPGTIAELKARLAKGEWIAIAGDRVPVEMGSRTEIVDFLGHPAAMSQGPILLANLLKSPVYLMACFKDAGGYHIDFQEFAEHIVLPRGNKAAAITGYVQGYAQNLEEQCQRYPMQWFNFFDFWAQK